MDKNIKYKGWLLQWNAEEQAWDLFTPEELMQPAGCRYPEFTLATIEDCKSFIDSY
jgi:hypothetical protein